MPPATEQAAPGAEGRLAAGESATPDALVPAPQGTLPPPHRDPHHLPLSGTCSSAYGVYADPRGDTQPAAVPRLAVTPHPDGGASLGGCRWRPVSYCVREPADHSSLATPVVGPPLDRRPLVAPLVPGPRAVRARPAWRQRRAGLSVILRRQPTTRSFGAADYPVTPAPASAQSTSPRGSWPGRSVEPVAGSDCAAPMRQLPVPRLAV